MTVLKLFAKCLLIVVMIPVTIQVFFAAIAIYAAAHTHAAPNVLSKAVAGFAVLVAFLAFLGWLASKLGAKQIKSALE